MITTPADRLLAFVDRRRHLLFALLALALLLTFNGRWRLGNDSTLYVSLARGIASGQGYHSVGWDRANAHFGLPLLIAASFRLLGPGTLWPVIALIFASGLAALALTYRLLRFRMPRPHAVAATLLVGIAFTFNAYLVELLTDMPGYLGMIAALTAFEALAQPRLSPKHRAAWLLLLFAGLWLGAIMRPVTWALMLAMLVVLAWRALRNRTLRKPALLAMALVAASLALFYLFDPRASHGTEAHEAWLVKVLLRQPLHTLHLMLTRTLPQILGPTTVEAAFGLSAGRWLSVPLALLLFGAALVAVRHRPLWLLWVLGNLFMNLVYPDPQTRYLLPILPFLALGFLQLALVLGRRPRFAASGLTLCLAFWLLPNTFRLAGLIYRQHCSDFLAAIDHGRYVPFAAMASQLHAHLPPHALIITDDGLTFEAFAPELHFLMPINDSPPPDLATQLGPALENHVAYMIDSDQTSTRDLLGPLHLLPGPPLLSVARPAWELPRFPERWLHPTTPPALPSLVLRKLTYQLPAPATTQRPSRQ